MSVNSYPKNVNFYRKGILRKWRWRITADNGKIIGASTQGYHNRQECIDNLLSVGKSIKETGLYKMKVPCKCLTPKKPE